MVAFLVLSVVFGVLFDWVFIGWTSVATVSATNQRAYDCRTYGDGSSSYSRCMVTILELEFFAVTMAENIFA